MPTDGTHKTHLPCVSHVEGKKRCYAQGGSNPYCSMHDPRLAAKRKAAGRVRHPRFAQVLSAATLAAAPEAPAMDRSRVPTIAYIIDRLLDIEDEASHGDGENGECTNAKGLSVAVGALREVRAILESERVRIEKERERAERAAGGGPSVPGAPLRPWLEADQSPATQ
jgi:hypothetical protein